MLYFCSLKNEWAWEFTEFIHLQWSSNEKNKRKIASIWQIVIWIAILAGPNVKFQFSTFLVSKLRTLWAHANFFTYRAKLFKGILLASAAFRIDVALIFIDFMASNNASKSIVARSVFLCRRAAMLKIIEFERYGKVFDKIVTNKKNTKTFIKIRN